MSVPLRILSVAPRYRMAVDGAHGGHYTVYQDDLRAGAARLGLPLEVLADRRATVDEGASTVLDTTDERTIAASVAGVLRPDDLVMVYEGSLAMVEAFVPVAADRPDVRFVVNLFRPEPGLVPARRSRGRARPSDRVAVRTLSDGVPDNLVISAETEARVELARRLGIACAGAWRVHSALWDVEADPAGHVRIDGSALRVLVPLADRGHSEDVVRDVATVLHLLRNHADGARVSITLMGAGSMKHSAQVRGPRLEALGAHRIVSPADRRAYAALSAAHDVIWIPNRQSYLTQSSGKALDALVVARPVMAPAGSWPAAESSRWAGEQLTYRDANGAARLLLDLRGRIHHLHDRLAQGSERIRAAYAPESTVLRVLELVAHGARPADIAPAHAAPDQLPLHPSGERSGGWTGSSHRFPTGQRLRASVAARSAARIGWSARVERQLHRRLPPLLTSISRRLRAAGKR